MVVLIENVVFLLSSPVKFFGFYLTQPNPQSYNEVFAGIFKYIDRIVSLVRPRKLLYMAIGKL